MQSNGIFSEVSEMDMVDVIGGSCGGGWSSGVIIAISCLIITSCLNPFKTEFTNLPLFEYIESFGLPGNTFCISNMNVLKILDLNFTEDNLEAIKVLCICKLLLTSSSFLDKETLDLYLSIVEKNKYGKQISYTNDEISVKILNDYVPEFVGKIWYTNHCSEEIMNDVSTITNQIIANYSKQIKEWEWLNTGSRYNLVEMISKAKVLVGHSSFSDYSKLELKESFFESILEVIKYEKHLQKEKLFTTFDAYEWIMPPQICNAYYNSTNNSINICAGYIYGSGYNINWSFEKKMACIGSIISHEISHVFCMYNFNDGSLIHRLLSGDDQKILQEKLNSLADLFSAHEILPGNYFKGKYCQGEIGADFFAMNFMMNYSKDFPGFDYKKFFETYAEISFEKYSEEIQNIYMNSDSHPPYYLRVNGILQQFDEFYETYNIQKKDGMYLSEKNRVKL